MSKSRIVLLLLCVVFLAAAITFFVLWRSSAAKVADFDRAQKRGMDEIRRIIYSKPMTLRTFPGVSHYSGYRSESNGLSMGFPEGGAEEVRHDCTLSLSASGVDYIGIIHIDRNKLPEESVKSSQDIAEYILINLAKQVLKADPRWSVRYPWPLETGGGNVHFICSTGAMTLTILPVEGKPDQFALMESYGFFSRPLWDDHEFHSLDYTDFNLKLHEDLK